MNDQLHIKVANARAAMGSTGEVIHAGNQPPRYELFHGANSICSQKVRCVLAYHRLPYVNNNCP
jgi:2,5-dichlorohydroquinone reductive dechlorinase